MNLDIKSILCRECYAKVKSQFQKDDDGKIIIGGEMPKLCEVCKKKMKEQFNRSIHPDRG
jgi:hypothetical protein